MLKKLTIVLGMAVAVAGTTTVSSFVFVPEAQAFGIGSIKKAGKKVGRKAKKGGKAIKRTAKKGGKAVGRAAKKGGKVGLRKGIIGIAKVGEYEVRAGKAVGRGAKRAGKAVGRVGKEFGKGVRDAGKGFGRTGKCIVKRNCKNTIGSRQSGTS